MEIHEHETLLDRYAKAYESDPRFLAEGLAIKLTEEMLECLELRGLSQSWLADRMGVSRAHVSSILNARPNMTLLTIAKIAIALGTKPDITLDTHAEEAHLPKVTTVAVGSTSTPETTGRADDIPWLDSIMDGILVVAGQPECLPQSESCCMIA